MGESSYLYAGWWFQPTHLKKWNWLMVIVVNDGLKPPFLMGKSPVCSWVNQ